MYVTTMQQTYIESEEFIQHTPVSEDEIREAFPLETPREGQIEIIQWILDKFLDKQFVILEAPTGVGKSVIGTTVAKFFNRSYYLTIQKILQDQLAADFGEEGSVEQLMVDLRGRNAYECTYQLQYSSKIHSPKMKLQIDEWNSNYHNCANGHCKKKGKNRYDECSCPYFNQADKAKNSKICAMNFASFLHQTRFTDRFQPRELLILDEGHNIETELMSFIELSITDHKLKNRFPVYETPEEYAEWMIDEEVINQLRVHLEVAKKNEDTKKADEYEALIRKVDYFIKQMEREDRSPWVVEIEEFRDSPNRKIVAKPIYVTEQAHEYLFSMGMKVLIMSATILDVNVMARSLGINKDSVAAKRMISRFPVENRPIYFNPVAKMTGGKSGQDRWGPKMVKQVNKYMADHKGEKGIIHTHNFSICDMLVNDCDRASRSRMLMQKNFKTKKEMLAEHAASEDSVIVAPAMHEGLDLKNDLSRFQIVCKVPFPNFYDDKQLAVRKDADPAFYNWLTALKLVQSVGRSIRSENDWAVTYIIDGSFEWWYKQNKKILPLWFRESLQGV